MKNRLLLVSMLSFLLTSLFAQNLQEGMLQMTVKDAFTGQRLLSEVTIAGKDHPQTLSTNKSGTTTLNAKHGKYHLTITANGYHPLTTHFTIENQLVLPVTIALERIQPYDLSDAQKGKMATIEGYIYDQETGEPLSGVEISFDIDQKKTRSNQQGYYQYTTTNFSAQKSLDSKILTTNISYKKTGYGSFIKKKVKLLPARLTIQTELKKGGADVVKTTVHGLDPQSQLLKKNNASNLNAPSKESANKMNCTSTLPTSIRVGTGCSCHSCGGVLVLPLNTYVGRGIDDEWIASWASASLKTGAVAFRTYGAYHAIYNPVGYANFDIAASPCRQAFDNSDAYTSCLNAAADTDGEYIRNGSNVAFAEYSAENNNCGCGDGFAGSPPGWPCISDQINAGNNCYGHGRGVSQWGSQRWALNGQSYDWILDHYYNPGSYYRCSNNAPNNLALNATSVHTSSNYSNSSTGHKAKDAVVSIGSKWTSNGASATSWLYYNLGANYNINQFVVKHAGAAGEWTSFNTQTYHLYKWGGSGWQWLASNNTPQNVTTHNVNTTAQWVLLYITDAGIDNHARIPEFEVYGTNAKSKSAQIAPPPSIFKSPATVTHRNEVEGSDLSGSMSLFVSPNPVSNDKLNIFYTLPAPTELLSIDIFDMQGRKMLPTEILQETQNNDQAELNISTLQNGVYFCRLVTSNGNSEITRFLVSR